MRVLSVLSIVVGGALVSGGSCRREHTHAPPPPYRDVFAVNAHDALAVRSGGSKTLIEWVNIRRGIRWRASVPRYAGSPQVPGLAASDKVVLLRVVSRGGADQVVLNATDGSVERTVHLTQGWPSSPSGYSLDPAMTVPGEQRCYQLVGDEHRGAVVAVSLDDGRAEWRHDVAGRIDLAVEVGSRLALVVAGKVELLDAATGNPVSAGPKVRVHVGGGRDGPYSLTSDLGALLVSGLPRTRPSGLELAFDPGAHALTSFDRVSQARLGTLPWPAGALAPEPHHYRDESLWLVFPDHLAVLDPRTLHLRATLGRAPSSSN